MLKKAHTCDKSGKWSSLVEVNNQSIIWGKKKTRQEANASTYYVQVSFSHGSVSFRINKPLEDESFSKERSFQT